MQQENDKPMTVEEILNNNLHLPTITKLCKVCEDPEIGSVAYQLASKYTPRHYLDMQFERYNRNIASDLNYIVEPLCAMVESTRASSFFKSALYLSCCYGSYLGDDILAMRGSDFVTLLRALPHIGLKQFRAIWKIKPAIDFFSSYTVICSGYNFRRLVLFPAQSGVKMSKETLLILSEAASGISGNTIVPYFWSEAATFIPLYYNTDVTRAIIAAIRLSCLIRMGRELRLPEIRDNSIVLSELYYCLSNIKRESLVDAIKNAENTHLLLREITITYVDLVYMLNDMGRTLEPVSGGYSIKTIRRMHDEAQIQHTNFLLECQQGYKEKIIYNDYAPKEYMTEDYKIILPETLADIIDEGDAMSHCVGSYADRHAQISEDAEYMTFIMFCRTHDNRRLATIEVQSWIPSGAINIPIYEVIQVRKKHNVQDAFTKRVGIEYEGFLNNILKGGE